MTIEVELKNERERNAELRKRITGLQDTIKGLLSERDNNDAGRNNNNDATGNNSNRADKGGSKQ